MSVIALVCGGGAGLCDPIYSPPVSIVQRETRVALQGFGRCPNLVDHPFTDAFASGREYMGNLGGRESNAEVSAEMLPSESEKSGTGTFEISCW